MVKLVYTLIKEDSINEIPNMVGKVVKHTPLSPTFFAYVGMLAAFLGAQLGAAYGYVKINDKANNTNSAVVTTSAYYRGKATGELLADFFGLWESLAVVFMTTMSAAISVLGWIITMIIYTKYTELTNENT